MKINIMDKIKIYLFYPLYFKKGVKKMNVDININDISNDDLILL